MLVYSPSAIPQPPLHESVRDRRCDLWCDQCISERSPEYLELADGDRERRDVHLRLLSVQALRRHRTSGGVRRSEFLWLVSVALRRKESYRTSGEPYSRPAG